MNSLQNYFNVKIAKSAWFASDGQTLIGHGRVSPQIKVLSFKKNALCKDLEQVDENIEIVPFGYRVYQNRSFYYNKGKMVSASRRKMSTKNRIALFCALRNRINPNDPILFGFIILERAEFPKMMLLANQINSGKKFVIKDIPEEKTQSTPVCSMSPASFGGVFSLQRSYDDVCNIYRDNRVLALLGTLSKKRKVVCNLYLYAIEEQGLTLEQLRALGHFVRFFCTVSYGFDFYSFTQPIENVEQIMQTLVTIRDQHIKDWYEQYIHELLVHEMTQVRVYAKYYIEACKQEGL